MTYSCLMEVNLENCRFFARHGVMEQEQVAGNEFEISIRVIYPNIACPVDDDLSTTISYADLYEIAKAEMSIPAKLMETVARRIAIRIESLYPEIQKIEVIVRKLTPPIPGITGSASVKFVRDLNVGTTPADLNVGA